ncbi:uncharacterized protein LOC114734927 [Neltuma alba]|uniref:uncharacterized protein LOC114734927 n=1 Tax=Neltuma alba TaxID=207710 RepID=UPI0010A43CA4|nr:uncharacterized protein LOC114734927 [Prosopis alba]
MEEDPLLSDLIDQEWTIPEPSEELKNLMKIYPVVLITPEEYNEWCRPWNRSLIITVLGAKFNVYRLKESLTKAWKFDNFELIDLPNNYYVVRFKNPEMWGDQYKRVLFEGPWIVGQHSVLVQRWSPYFDPFNNPLGRVATWVRIPHIPLLCYTKNFIWRLGDMIGKTLKVDMNTIANLEDKEARVERGRYARICVEIDLQKKLIPRIISASALFNVEYEGLGLICFQCGRYGHRKEVCPWKKSAEKVESQQGGSPSSPPPKMSPAKSLPAEEDQFGP